MAKREIVWDLSEMFPSITDPSVEKAIEGLALKAESFALKYQGKIIGFSAETLLKAIEDFEEYYIELDNITTFAYLSFMANMTSPDTQSLYDKVNKVKAKLDKTLAFFNIELGGLVNKKPEITDEPILLNYRHFLERLRKEVPHQLSEAEEKLIIEKDQFGIKGWEELQGKWLNTRSFEVEVEGKKKLLSFSEAAGLLENPDRLIRESAAKSIYDHLGKDGEIFASALRNICNDWMNVCNRRKYASPMEASLLANDIDQQTIHNLLTTVETNTSYYHRYLRLKAKMLKLPKLGSQDISAPIPDTPNIKFDYDTARNLVVEAYSGFDEDFVLPRKACLPRIILMSHQDWARRMAALVRTGTRANQHSYSLTSTMY